MIGHYGQSLGPQERGTHRAWIGVRVEALLAGYWNADPSDMVKDEILRDWMAILEPYAPDEITASCREWLREHPDRKPRPGDIAKPIIAARGLAVAAARTALPQPDRPAPATKEQAAAILTEAGFRLNRFGGITHD